MSAAISETIVEFDISLQSDFLLGNYSSCSGCSRCKNYVYSCFSRWTRNIQNEDIEYRRAVNSNDTDGKPYKVQIIGGKLFHWTLWPAVKSIRPEAGWLRRPKRVCYYNCIPYSVFLKYCFILLFRQRSTEGQYNRSILILRCRSFSF